MTTSTPFPVLHIQRIHQGIYEWQLTLGGYVQAREDGLESITTCLAQACDFSEDTYAIEIRYRGVGVGTFPVHVLQASPDTIADRIVALFSEVLE